MEHFKEQINSKSFFGSLSSAQVIKLILFKYLQINQKVCDIVRDATNFSRRENTFQGVSGPLGIKAQVH